eukprot:SAG22_NODE_54_length_23787_cov_12.917511_3_plen_262_part_00
MASLIWGAEPEPEKAAKVTLFRHMWGLLLGSASELAALTSMDATGGHGPDSDVWWEHIFLLRVERAPLLAMLASAGETQGQKRRQNVIKMCLGRCLAQFDRAAAAGADCGELDAVRGGHCGEILAVLFYHVLHVQRMTYVQTMQLWDGAFFNSLLTTLLRALRSGQQLLQGGAVELLLTIATAEPSLSRNTTFGQVLGFALTAPSGDRSNGGGSENGKQPPDTFAAAVVALLGQGGGGAIAGERSYALAANTALLVTIGCW